MGHLILILKLVFQKGRNKYNSEIIESRLHFRVKITFFRVKESSKIGKTLEIDIHSKMEIRFKVKEAKTGEALLVHQAFVVFVHSNTRQEIIFVVTPDHNHNYIFDVVWQNFFFQ